MVPNNKKYKTCIRQKYNVNIIEQVCDAKNKIKGKTDLDYQRQERYDDITVRKDKKLIMPLTENNKCKIFRCGSRSFQYEAHLSIGHVGQNKTLKYSNNKFSTAVKKRIPDMDRGKTDSQN